jgi:mono/diheme cytochrome c family protein
MRAKRDLVKTSLSTILACACLSLVLASPVIGQDGKKLYGDRCAICHGPDGDGKGVIMQTASFGADFWKANNDAAISKVIVEGNGRMPAIPIGPEETKVVVEYMKSTFKK